MNSSYLYVLNPQARFTKRCAHSLHPPLSSTFRRVSFLLEEGKDWIGKKAVVLVSSRVWSHRRIGPILLTSVGCRHRSFPVHLIDLLSILLRCSGFSGMQKAVVDQTGNTLPNSDHDLFCCKFGFGKCSGASSRSNHRAGCHIKSTFHRTSQSNREMVRYC